jgi:hypothetical protein
MPDDFDKDFSGPDDAMAEIRAAVSYLLKGAAGSDRGDIVREIIAIVNEVARGLPPGGGQRSPGRWHARWLDAGPKPRSQIRTAPAPGLG